MESNKKAEEIILNIPKMLLALQKMSKGYEINGTTRIYNLSAEEVEYLIKESEEK